MSDKLPPGSDDDDIDATVMRPMAFQRPGASPLPGASPPLGVPPPPPAPSSPAPSSTILPRQSTQPFAPPPAAAAPPRLPGFAALDETTLAALTSHGLNPLLSAAMPLLVLVSRLRDLQTHNDVEGLRERVIEEVRRFETTAIQGGLTTDQIRVGRYALCATVDDVVMNTPWGGQSDWAGRSLVSTIHKETWGGERFFDLLDQMQADAPRYLLELELLYACLALGFEGRYRVTPRGHGELARLRDGLYRVLRRERGDTERELSPQWRGITDRYRPLGAVVPLWVGAAVLAALLMFIYMALAYSLSGQTDAVYRKLASLLPNRPVEIVRLTAPLPVVRPPAAAPAQTVYNRIATALANDVAAGQLAVIDQGADGVVVRTRAAVFVSGSDAIEPVFQPVIDRVAKALAAESGPVQVVGHTDSVPIRTIRFPSNQELSEARAEAVVRRLAQGMGGPQRLTAEGRGAREPIASNDIPDGRQQNRRIDILLLAR